MKTNYDTKWKMEKIKKIKGTHEQHINTIKNMNKMKTNK